MMQLTAPAPRLAVADEIAALALDPGAYPIRRLARAIEDCPTDRMPSTAALREAVALRERTLA